MEHLDFFDKYNLMLDQVLIKMKDEGTLENSLNMFTRINVAKLKLMMEKKEKNIEKIFKLDNIYEEYKEVLNLELAKNVIEMITEKENIKHVKAYGKNIDNKNLQNNNILNQIMNKELIFDVCYKGIIKSKEEIHKVAYIDIYTQTYVLDYFERMSNLTEENPIFLKNLHKFSKILNTDSEFEKSYGFFQLVLNYRKHDNGKKLLKELLKEDTEYQKLGIGNTLMLLKIINNLYSNNNEVKDIFFNEDEIRDPIIIKTAILEEMEKYKHFYENDINMFLKDIYENNIDSLNYINENLERDEKRK